MNAGGGDPWHSGRTVRLRESPWTGGAWGLAVERERLGNREQKRRDRTPWVCHRFAAWNVSVRLKNGMTCSWKRTATSLVCVPG